MVIVDGISTPYSPGMFSRKVPIVNASSPTKNVQLHNTHTSTPTTQQKIIKKKYEQLQSSKKQRKKIYLAKDIMSSPVRSLSPDTTIKTAWKIFSQQEFRHLPITQNNKIIGLLSERDLLKKTQTLFDIKNQDSNNHAHTLITEIMTTQVLSATPDTEIRDIAKILFDENIGCMPLIDDNEHLTGILTRKDILRAVINKAPIDLWC